MAASAATIAPTHGHAVAGKARRDHFAGLLVPLLFIGTHAIFGVLLTTVPGVATVQAGIVVLVSLWAAFMSSRLELAIWTAAYVASCDVLWRMTEARVPWELAKYLLLMLMAAAFFRHVKVQRRAAGPIIFILLLIPSCALTFMHMSIPEARELASAYLAGPLALGFAVLLFRQLVADSVDFSRIAWIALGPIATITAIASWTTATTPDLEFGEESNFASSGGYGPNQVSTIIGLGALLCLLLALLPGVRRAKAIQLTVGVWMLVQTFLTFSRGGIYGLIIAACAIGVVGIVTSGARSRAVVGGVVMVLCVVGAYAWADGFSQGSLDDRYGEKNTETRRTGMAEADIHLFSQYPLFGVGPGRSESLRGFDDGNAAHTEFTRLVAEHGIFGFFAFVLMATFCVQAFRQALGPWNRMMVTGMAFWSLATMTHSATRIVAVSFAFGLMALRVHVSRGRSETVAPPVFVLRAHRPRSAPDVVDGPSIDPSVVVASPSPAR